MYQCIGGITYVTFPRFFIALSNNTYLNETAKKVGPRMGANKVVAGNTIPQLIEKFNI